MQLAKQRWRTARAVVRPLALTDMLCDCKIFPHRHEVSHWFDLESPSRNAQTCCLPCSLVVCVCVRALTHHCVTRNVLTCSGKENLVINHISWSCSCCIWSRLFVLIKHYINAWRRMLEKLTVAQLVKKFTAFNETLKFTVMFTRARQRSVSSHVNPIYIFIYYFLRSVLILLFLVHCGLKCSHSIFLLQLCLHFWYLLCVL
jgi:hypothetical protein